MTTIKIVLCKNDGCCAMLFYLPKENEFQIKDDFNGFIRFSWEEFQDLILNIRSVKNKTDYIRETKFQKNPCLPQIEIDLTVEEKKQVHIFKGPYDILISVAEMFYLEEKGSELLIRLNKVEEIILW